MGSWYISFNLYHFKKIIFRYKKISYNIDVLRLTACFVVNPIKVSSFATPLIARRKVGPQTE